MSAYGRNPWRTVRPFYWERGVERVTNGIYTIELYDWNPGHGELIPSVSVEMPNGTSANGNIYAETESYRALLFDWRPFPDYVYRKAWQLCGQIWPEYIAARQRERDERVAAELASTTSTRKEDES